MYMYTYMYIIMISLKKRKRERPKFEGELEEVCGRVWREKMKQRNIVSKL